jgi:uncharacterized protein YjiS (DUF1127 family)
VSAEKLSDITLTRHQLSSSGSGPKGTEPHA